MCLEANNIDILCLKSLGSTWEKSSCNDVINLLACVIAWHQCACELWNSTEFSAINSWYSITDKLALWKKLTKSNTSDVAIQLNAHLWHTQAQMYLHNRDGVSNYRKLHLLFCILFRSTTQKIYTSSALLVRYILMSSDAPTQRASNVESVSLSLRRQAAVQWMWWKLRTLGLSSTY